MNDYYKQQVDEWLENRGKYYRCGRCNVQKLAKDILHDGICVDCIAIENKQIEQNLKHGDF